MLEKTDVCNQDAENLAEKSRVVESRCLKEKDQFCKLKCIGIRI